MPAAKAETGRPDNVRIRAVLVFEYETNQADYDDPTPEAMVRLDIETDPTIVLDSDWNITSAQIVPS